jgi:hypothetical protein
VISWRIVLIAAGVVVLGGGAFVAHQIGSRSSPETTADRRPAARSARAVQITQPSSSSPTRARDSVADQPQLPAVVTTTPPARRGLDALKPAPASDPAAAREQAEQRLEASKTGSLTRTERDAIEGALAKHDLVERVPGSTHLQATVLSAASCKAPDAQRRFDQLAAGDRDRMRRRCAKFDVVFAEPAPR